MPDHLRFRRIPIALLFLLFLATALVLLVAALKPNALALVTAAYKLHVLTAAALVGWWLDHVLLFPYARPASYLVQDWRFHSRAGVTGLEGKQEIPHHPVQRGSKTLFMVASIRRAIVVAATIIAAALVL